MFDKAKQLWDLQKKARSVQKELKETLIDAQALDGKITVTFNAEMKLQDIKLDPSLFENGNSREVEEGLKNAITEALAKAQGIAAEKTRAVMGDLGLNLPGM